MSQLAFWFQDRGEAHVHLSPQVWVFCVSWSRLITYLAVLRMASLLESYIQDPSASLLQQCTKEQLPGTAEHYKIYIQDKTLKESVKTCLKDGQSSDQCCA